MNSWAHLIIVFQLSIINEFNHHHRTASSHLPSFGPNNFCHHRRDITLHHVFHSRCRHFQKSTIIMHLLSARSQYHSKRLGDLLAVVLSRLGATTREHLWRRSKLRLSVFVAAISIDIWNQMVTLIGIIIGIVLLLIFVCIPCLCAYRHHYPAKTAPTNSSKRSAAPTNTPIQRSSARPAVPSPFPTATSTNHIRSKMDNPWPRSKFYRNNPWKYL